mgnify:FL=1
MSIQKQLEKVSTRTTEHLLQFMISKKQDKVLQTVARHWSDRKNKLSVSELVRRCINLTLSNIRDPKLLAKIRGIMNPDQEV